MLPTLAMTTRQVPVRQYRAESSVLRQLFLPPSSHGGPQLLHNLRANVSCRAQRLRLVTATSGPNVESLPTWRASSANADAKDVDSAPSAARGARKVHWAKLRAHAATISMEVTREQILSLTPSELLVLKKLGLAPEWAMRAICESDAVQSEGGDVIGQMPKLPPPKPMVRTGSFSESPAADRRTAIMRRAQSKGRLVEGTCASPVQESVRSPTAQYESPASTRRTAVLRRAQSKERLRDVVQLTAPSPQEDGPSPARASRDGVRMSALPTTYTVTEAPALQKATWHI